MRVGEINAGKNTFLYPDGSQIRIESAFGSNYVYIYAPSGGVNPFCSIVLYDQDYNLLHLPPPKLVPPMKCYELDTGQ